MKCPKCGSFDTCRARRQSWDQVFAWFNRWPYQCRACTRPFRASARQAPSRHFSGPAENGGSPKGAQAKQKAPVRGRIQVRTHPEELMAGIVIQADSQSELNNILLTLGSALSSYGHAKQPQYKEENAWK